MKQLILIPKTKASKEHGGTFSIGRRRKLRPLSVKSPIHLVLRSDFAYGNRSLLRHRPLIKKIIKKAEKRFHIKIYEIAVVSNHIHLLIKGKHRKDIQNFFRVVAGHIAQDILRQFPILKTDIAGGAPNIREKDNKFWQTRIYSRLVSWGREFIAVKKYIIQNTLEALGLIPYKERLKVIQKEVKKSDEIIRLDST
jgi:REP element-mobilizing transposase RayT